MLSVLMCMFDGVEVCVSSVLREVRLLDYRSLGL